MQLSEWLSQNNVRPSEFAARIGVSPQAVTGYCKGTFWITKERAQRIFDETGGAVTPTDLMQTKQEASS